MLAHLPSMRACVANTNVEADPARARRAAREEVFALHAAGEIEVVTEGADAFVGLEAIPRAVEHMLSGATAGKVVATIASQ